ncbi:hypothetical protein EAH89_25255 [Roseomonas nepalensis]|uniref:Uncharacterized protein n=1 Tax=Muricoccus nepalensis TaxID=1854500 RepID=A0A502F9G1_9PROT|nr:hypothetical protein [Roseomonas nepalensis]TPG46038.1 hypothetical protein EAH89_25255 [Roseomonas nepalensis]
MAHTLSTLHQQLQQALLTSLEIHLDGLDDPAARRAALDEACGRLSKHLTAPLLSLRSSGSVPWKHPALIGAALHAAAQQLRGQLADA